MDVNLIKQRMENITSKKPKGEKKDYPDYKKIFWKPTIGKHEIRIVPSKFDKQNPFRELSFHYGIGSKKVMLALTNFGEKDPIVELVKNLKAQDAKGNWDLIKKISPKLRFFVPIIVRGEEEQGVRWWEFGKEMYTELVNLAADDEIGDYTSVTNGRDIKVNTIGPDKTGTDYNKSTPTVKLKSSKLSENKEEVEKWLTEQPDLLSVYKRYSFDEMKQILSDWLTPKEEEDGEETKPTKSPSPKTSVKAPVKKSKKDEFSEVFEEEEAEDNSDDLPF